MSVLSLAIAAAAMQVAPDCDALNSTEDLPLIVITEALRQCQLQQSESQFPDLDCKEPATQMAMNVCSYRDHLHADIALNRVWNVLRQNWGDGDDPNWQRLIASQKAWIAFRDAHCEVWGGMYEGGSIVPLMRNSCVADTTKQRTKQLEALVDLP